MTTNNTKRSAIERILEDGGYFEVHARNECDALTYVGGCTCDSDKVLAEARAELAALRDAVAAEREACAALADQYEYVEKASPADVAAAIRHKSDMTQEGKA